MAAAGPRNLSDLSDDLLLRILFFAPAREAAATAVLSRRWRALWRASGAAYLDSRYLIDRGRCSSPEEHGQSPGWGQPTKPCKPCFLHGAEKALAAATVPITRLKFVVADDLVTKDDDDLIGAALSNPAARRVEELHIEVDHRRSSRSLSFGSLPSQALRVLRLTNCSSLAAPRPGAAFPRLADLRLHECTVPLVDLQRIVGAAPWLAALHLESSCLPGEKKTPLMLPLAAQRYRLVCPAVTALVFADCRIGLQWEEVSIELDVPRLQSFRYKGAVQACNRLSLKPQTPPPANMIQADVHLIEADDYSSGVFSQAPTPPLAFWQFMQSFSSAILLKLTLDFSMGLVAMTSQDELPGRRVELFPNLERLELDARYTAGYEEEGSMAILPTLLHGCPVVRDLRLKLSKDHMQKFCSIDQEARADFGKSVGRFRHRRSPMPSLGGADDDGNNYEASGNNHVLREQSFSCLESHLRRVSLHFRMDNPNCLGVQLAKFFADNARALEEIYIDDGSQKMCEHMIFSKMRLVRRHGARIFYERAARELPQSFIRRKRKKLH